jgi:hypothetical protein
MDALQSFGAAATYSNFNMRLGHRRFLGGVCNIATGPDRLESGVWENRGTGRTQFDATGSVMIAYSREVSSSVSRQERQEI